MAYFGKLFVINKGENVESFIRSMKMPAEKIDKCIRDCQKASQKLVKDGDSYILTYTFGDKTSEVKFQNGVEFEEDVEPLGVTKNVITVDGDKYTQVQTFKDGSVITLVKEFSSELLVQTITSNFWDGTAKEYFVAQ